jgi:hypothetical protein
MGKLSTHMTQSFMVPYLTAFVPLDRISLDFSSHLESSDRPTRLVTRGLRFMYGSLTCSWCLPFLRCVPVGIDSVSLAARFSLGVGQQGKFEAPPAVAHGVMNRERRAEGSAITYRRTRIDWKEEAGIFNLLVETHPGDRRLYHNVHTAPLSA